MSYIQRLKNIALGVAMLLFSVILFMVPDNGCLIIAAILSISLTVYGFGLLWYYFTMASHMVGGKAFLYQAVIVLDFSMFTTAMMSMAKLYVLIYMIGIHIFAGGIDILRALEEKRCAAPSWRIKLISGIISIVFAVILAAAGTFFKRADILVYGYCGSLAYSAVVRIVSAFRRTAVVFYPETF